MGSAWRRGRPAPPALPPYGRRRTLASVASANRRLGGRWRPLLGSAAMSKVAYQGEPGAYSERAVRALFPDAEPLPCETVRLVFSRVTSGEAPFGVVPLENSQAGLGERDLRPAAAHRACSASWGRSLVRVDHALLGVPGARLEDDAPGALPLAGPRAVRGVPGVAADRARARARHGGSGAPDRRARAIRTDAAIASVSAGEQVRSGGAGRADPDREGELHEVRCHRSRRTRALGAPDKTSLVMAVLDEPGSLLASLQPFADRGTSTCTSWSRGRAEASRSSTCSTWT